MSPDLLPLLLLLGTLAAWYVSTYALVDAAGRPFRRSLGGRRGLLTAVPLVILTVGAAAAGRADVAVAAAFAAAAAAGCLALGAALASAPRDAPPVPAGRAWAFLLPAALIALVAGFTGRLTGLHAVCLLIEGAVIAGTWSTDRPPAAPNQPADPAPPAPPPAVSPAVSPATTRRIKAIELSLALLLAGVAAWLALAAVGRSETALGRPAGTPMASLFGIMLVLPCVGLAGQRAAQHRTREAAGAQIAYALAALCLALPAAILTAYARALVLPATAAAASTTRPAALALDLPTVVFPPAVWRVDALFLVILGLALTPTAGRLRLGRGTGLLLVLLYVVFINVVARTH